jgi:hypothetical protein
MGEFIQRGVLTLSSGRVIVFLMRVHLHTIRFQVDDKFSVFALILQKQKIEWYIAQTSGKIFRWLRSNLGCTTIGKPFNNGFAIKSKSDSAVGYRFCSPTTRGSFFLSFTGP